MHPRLRTYTTYSIATAVAWTIVIVVAGGLDPAKATVVRRTFMGFALGWLAATIARYLYPPPRKYRPRRQPS